MVTLLQEKLDNIRDTFFNNIACETITLRYKYSNVLSAFLKIVNHNFLAKEFQYIIEDPWSEDSNGNIIYHPYNMGHKIFKIKQEELKFNKDENITLPLEFFDLSSLKENSEELWTHFKDSYTRTIKEVYDNLMSLN